LRLGYWESAWGRFGSVGWPLLPRTCASYAERGEGERGSKVLNQSARRSCSGSSKEGMTRRDSCMDSSICTTHKQQQRSSTFIQRPPLDEGMLTCWPSTDGDDDGLDRAVKIKLPGRHTHLQRQLLRDQDQNIHICIEAMKCMCLELSLALSSHPTLPKLGSYFSREEGNSDKLFGYYIQSSRYSRCQRRSHLFRPLLHLSPPFATGP
jgi:hypothetical protein